MFTGIAAGLVVCVNGVSKGTLGVGDTVLFMTLMVQLYEPLNYFGTYYRIIQKYMIDMENLFELLEKQPGVSDHLWAKPLLLCKGEVQFKNVWFEYEAGNAILKDINFTARPGTTVAFVGATGSGKSTLTRLIFR